MNTPAQQTRLLSLDTLRGFDMLFIMGGAPLLASLATLLPHPFFQTIAAQMQHAAWDGLTHHDTIFPLFLFIAGISFPYSLAKQREQGRTSRRIHTKILQRGITLALLGIIYNGLLSLDFEHLRYASVLGRIGLAWMFAALIYTNTATRTRLLINASILLGYWLLLAYLPAPDAEGAGPFTIQGSLAGYIDRMLLPGRLHMTIHDPEGLLSTLPAISTALLGMSTGELIRLNRPGLTDRKKVCLLLASSALLLLIGLMWNNTFPINKNLWTSSFVCVVGAYSIALFALFYYLIDVLGLQRWTFFFRIIGLNSITIYMAQQFINFSFTSQALFGGILRLMPPSAQPLIYWTAYITVCWTFLYILYRQRIFLKV